MSANATYIYGQNGQRLAYTNNKGATWYTLNNPCGEIQNISTNNNGAVLLIACYGGSVSVSTDYGRSFAPQVTLGNGPWLGAASNGDGTVLYAVGSIGYDLTLTPYVQNKSFRGTIGQVPSPTPTAAPTYTTIPSSRPTLQPSRIPSCQPTIHPSRQPTSNPSHPSSRPTLQPSTQPYVLPSTQPSNQPSRLPTAQPSSWPSKNPTYAINQILVRYKNSSAYTSNGVIYSAPYKFTNIMSSSQSQYNYYLAVYIAGASSNKLSFTITDGTKTVVGDCTIFLYCSSDWNICVINVPVNKYIVTAQGGSLSLNVQVSNMNKCDDAPLSLFPYPLMVKYELVVGGNRVPTPAPSSYKPTTTENAVPVPNSSNNNNSQYVLISGNAQTYVIVLVAILYVGFGVAVTRTRDEDKTVIVPLSIGAICLFMLLQGVNLSSELFTVVSMLSKGYTKELAIPILFFRFFPAIPLVAYFAFRFKNSYYPLLVEENLFRNYFYYGAVLFLSTVQSPLLLLLPWKDTPLARLSDGYPDYSMFATTQGYALVDNLVKIVCQALFIHRHIVECKNTPSDTSSGGGGGGDDEGCSESTQLKDNIGAYFSIISSSVMFLVLLASFFIGSMVSSSVEARIIKKSFDQSSSSISSRKDVEMADVNNTTISNPMSSSSNYNNTNIGSSTDMRFLEKELLDIKKMNKSLEQTNELLREKSDILEGRVLELEVSKREIHADMKKVMAMLSRTSKLNPRDDEENDK